MIQLHPCRKNYCVVDDDKSDECDGIFWEN